MKRILLVAEREFMATVATKAFIFAALLTPVLIGALVVLMPRLMRESPPSVEGEVAIIDPTGQVEAGLRDYLTPERLAQRREEMLKRLQEVMPAPLRSAPRAGPAVEQSLEQSLGEVPTLRVVTLSPTTDLEAAKEPLREGTAPAAANGERLALVVVHADAIVRDGNGKPFGSYDLYVRGKLDDRIESEISDGVRDAIITARVAASGLDRAQIDELTKIERVTSRSVTAGGEDRTNRVLNQLIPMAFMGLLLMSVLMSGQYLLTTTVEEKTNRVVEVLLSAVSPMELMIGKILGQMGVGLVVLALYLGLGLMALVSFASLGLVDPILMVFLFVFYLLAYLSIGAFMAAIGSAVNEMREAQGLMTPVMLIIMIPWFLWMPISRDPNATYAVALSFIPPLSNFVIMLRMASATPPPFWQVGLSVLAGLVGVAASLWFAGKVFRVGLLMFGKPPNLATLIRWARMG